MIGKSRKTTTPKIRRTLNECLVVTLSESKEKRTIGILNSLNETFIHVQYFSIFVLEIIFSFMFLPYIPDKSCFFLDPTLKVCYSLRARYYVFLFRSNFFFSSAFFSLSVILKLHLHIDCSLTIRKTSPPHFQLQLGL